MSKEIIDYGFGVIETRETFYTEETIKQKDKKIADLEAKLAESEKKAYSRGHSQRDIANEIKLNALREDVANKEKRIVELKQQLEEKDKEKNKMICHIGYDNFKYLIANNDWQILEAHQVKEYNQLRKANQDKILFAVEQLEKLKVELHIIHTNGYLKAIDEEIDNQIKAIKGDEVV